MSRIENNTADMTLARDIAVKVSNNETQDNTTYLLSSTKNEHRPGVYTYLFVSGEHYWNRLHYLTSQKAYSNSIFKDGHRHSDNVTGLGRIIIYDIDDGYTIQEAQEILKEYQYLMVTTTNHQKDKNGLVCDRFRILLISDSELHMTNDEHRRFMPLLAESIGLDPMMLDKNCFGITAAYKPCKTQTHWYNDGKLVSVEKDMKLAIAIVEAEEFNRKNQPKKEYMGDKQKLLDALYTIDPDCHYDEWFSIGSALKTEFGEEGFSYFDSWSSGGRGYNEIATQKKWNQFIPGRYTGGTIMRFAS